MIVDGTEPTVAATETQERGSKVDDSLERTELMVEAADSGLLDIVLGGVGMVGEGISVVGSGIAGVLEGLG